MTKIVLKKFGSDSCSPCRAMARAKTLEKFATAHADIKLEVFDIDTAAGDKLADEYDVQGIPCFIFEDEDGNVLAKDEGATNLAGLEKLYEKALKNLEEGKFGKSKRKKKKPAAPPAKKAPSKAAVEDEQEEDDDEDEDDEFEGEEEGEADEEEEEEEEEEAR